MSYSISIIYICVTSLCVYLMHDSLCITILIVQFLLTLYYIKYSIYIADILLDIIFIIRLHYN